MSAPSPPTVPPRHLRPSVRLCGYLEVSGISGSFHVHFHSESHLAAAPMHSARSPATVGRHAGHGWLATAGVMVNKRVGNRIIKKRLHVRIEHVQHSKSRIGFLK